MSKLIQARAVLKRHRRLLIQRLTLGLVSKHENAVALDPNRVSRVLICRPNHRLGNLIALTALLTELENLLPWAEVDVVVAGGIANELFSGYSNLNRVFLLPHYAFKSPLKYIKGILAIRKIDYDLVINSTPYSSTGRLIANLSKAGFRILAPAKNANQSSEHLAKDPVYLLRGYLNDNRQQPQGVPLLDIRLTNRETQWGKETLARIFQQRQQAPSARTIALFTHATDNKCYDTDWWQQFYKLISEQFSDHSFIEILPAHAQSNLNFAIPAFYSSDIRNLASLISATDVFIGADGGVMHLASAAGVQTVGLFSVTDPELFGPHGEGDFSIITTDKSHRLIAEEITENLANSVVNITAFETHCQRD